MNDTSVSIEPIGKGSGSEEADKSTGQSAGCLLPSSTGTLLGQLTTEDSSQRIDVEVCLRHDGVVHHGKLVDAENCHARVQSRRQVWKLQFQSPSASVSHLVGEFAVISCPQSRWAEFELVIRNPRPMDHPGGNWDLGAQGNTEIDELSVRFSGWPTEPDGKVSVRANDDCGIALEGNRLRLVQASSGGEYWNSSNHLNRHGTVGSTLRGFRLDVDEQEVFGDRIQPVVAAHHGAESIQLAQRNFWQNFPNAVDASPESIALKLFSSDAGPPVELQGGEQKTFEFAVARESLESNPGSGSHIPKYLDPAFSHVTKNVDGGPTIALSYLTESSGFRDERYEALVKLAIEGDDTFAIKAEKIDQFGWRNFGDLYGDHEAVYHQGESPMISHYNNQYDCTLGFGIQFLRSGDKRWFELMTQMADHAWDIDTYHTDQDKLLYNGGLFWHTYHYADAHTATHRSYPKQLRFSQSFDGGTDLDELGETGDRLANTYQVGGGPAAAHNYSTGWMLAYYLTGKERYKTAAINAADYVIRIDDGSKTPFKWLCRSDTGFSTCSSDGYYGPGRASGNSIHALLTGHELTSNDFYLDRAAILMRRTTHPLDDLNSLDLLNAELRWFYTMHLQALGRLVDYKDSLDQRDEDFRYGVATLLHYANWMAEHERPTLSEPEKLQYPTETWAAQDIRKWHVLEHAAKYECDPHKRERLLKKADFFFNYVVDYLNESPTKSLTRPVVIMLNFGWQREWFLEHRDALRLDTAIEDNFGTPQSFVPQRAIAMKRFKLIAAASITLISIALSIGVTSVLLNLVST